MDPFLWREYFGEIFPKLHWASGFPGNQTLPGLVARLTEHKPFPSHVALMLYGGQLLTLLVIVGLMARGSRERWREPRQVCAASAALIAWLIAFSPCAWEHWPIWLAPFWGWMLWEARQSAPRAVMAVLALGLMYVPMSIFTNPGFFRADLRLAEPWNSSQLGGVLLAMALGVARLARDIEPVPSRRRIASDGPAAHPRLVGQPAVVGV
jgi:hypothetical protein